MLLVLPPVFAFTTEKQRRRKKNNGKAHCFFPLQWEKSLILRKGHQKKGNPGRECRAATGGEAVLLISVSCRLPGDIQRPQMTLSL
jgi:hypothetical protein